MNEYITSFLIISIDDKKILYNRLKKRLYVDHISKFNKL